jgi:flagellar basal body-associated protein FliL
MGNSGKGGNKMNSFIIVLITVVLIGLGAALYFYLSEKKHKHH